MSFIESYLFNKFKQCILTICFLCYNFYYIAGVCEKCADHWTGELCDKEMCTPECHPEGTAKCFAAKTSKGIGSCICREGWYVFLKNTYFDGRFIKICVLLIVDIIYVFCVFIYFFLNFCSSFFFFLFF